MGLKQILGLLIGILVFIVLILLIGLEDLFSSLADANLFIASICLLVLLADDLFEAFKLRVLFYAAGRDAPVAHILRSYIVTKVFRAIFPLRASEFTMSLFMKKKGFTHMHVFGVIIFEMSVAFLVLSVISTIAILEYISIGYAISLGMITTFIFFLAVIIATDRRFTPWLPRYGKLWTDHLKRMRSSARSLYTNRRIMVFDVIADCINWSITHTAMYIALLSVGADVTFLGVFLVNSLVTLLSLVPLSPGNIGIKEAAGTALFTLFLGVPLPVALNAMILLRLAEYLLALAYYVVSFDFIRKHYERQKSSLSKS